MDKKCESETGDKIGEDALMKEIERLKKALQSERASRAEENLRAKENEEKLKQELERMKTMLITFDEIIRQTKRNPEEIKTCDADTQTEENTTQQTVLLEEIESLKNILQNEQASRAEEELRAKEREENFNMELDNVTKMLLTISDNFERHEKQREALEKDLSLFLKKEKSFPIEVRDELVKLEQQERQVENTCQDTGSQSSQEKINKIKAPQYEEKDMQETTKQEDMVALQEENLTLETQSSSHVEQQDIKVEVRVDPSPQPSQVSCGCSEELPATPTERRRTSQWRRFINFCTCDSRRVESDD